MTDPKALTETRATIDEKAPPRLPRWLVRTIWAGHRAAYSLTGGHFGLRPLRRPVVVSRSIPHCRAAGGRSRIAILGYLEDGERLLIPAMNGWADPQPAWWLNLQATPLAVVELPGGVRREVTARGAVGEERDAFWRRFVDLGTLAYTDASAAQRSRETAIVVLEPVRLIR